MELTRIDAVFSRIAMVLFLCRNKVLRITWNFTESRFGINKKYQQKNQQKGAHTLFMRVEGAPLPHGPLGPSPTSTPTLYIHVWGEKNQREGFIAFYNTEAPPSLVLPREGWSGVRPGLWRGESVAIVITNHPPSPISWCSLPCVCNPIVGLLDSDWLDEIYHVIE